MKKFLKIALVIFACVCLINLTNNNTKAEELNDAKVMVKGMDFHDNVTAFLNDHGYTNVTKIKFIKGSNFPSTVVDLSQDGSIKGYVNEDGDTFFCFYNKF